MLEQVRRQCPVETSNLQGKMVCAGDDKENVRFCTEFLMRGCNCEARSIDANHRRSSHRNFASLESQTRAKVKYPLANFYMKGVHV